MSYELMRIGSICCSLNTLEARGREGKKELSELSAAFIKSSAYFGRKVSLRNWFPKRIWNIVWLLGTRVLGNRYDVTMQWNHAKEIEKGSKLELKVSRRKMMKTNSKDLINQSGPSKVSKVCKSFQIKGPLVKPFNRAALINLLQSLQ